MSSTTNSKAASSQCHIVLVRDGKEYTVDYFARQIKVSRSCAIDKLRQHKYIPEGWGRGKSEFHRLSIPWTNQIEQECQPDSRFNHPGARKGASDQLCWDCTKCCGGCPWSDAFVLPEGAVAEPSHRAGNHHDGRGAMNTYRITECPMYEQDTRDPFEVRSDEPDAAKRLLRSIVKRAARDYACALVYVRDNPKLLSPENIEAVEKSRFQFGAVRVIKDCESFFRSEWFEDILDQLGIESFPPNAWIKAIQADPDRIASARGVFGSEEDDIDDVDDEDDKPSCGAKMKGEQE